MNSILNHGMPELFKTSLVVPLLKKSGLDIETLTNYRPISQLPFLSKIAERLVLHRLSRFLEDNKILDPRQTAFRPFHSCESALTYISDYALHWADSGRITVLVLLDLSAAFDCVDHRILLNVLESIGITDNALNWFKCYLTNRQQATVVDSVTSSYSPINCGVPQGSVLGPVLFSLYLTGLQQIIAPYHVDYILYADDIQLIVSTIPDSLDQTITRLESCIIDIRNWLVSRRLALNGPKTEAILLGNKRALRRCPHKVLHIEEASIEFSTTVRSLGVQLDSHLSMEAYVNKIRSGAFSRLRLIARVRRNLRSDAARLLVKSLVLSNLHFCTSLLTGISSKCVHRLQQILNASVRLIYNRKKRDGLNDLLAKEKLLPIRQHIDLRVLSLLHSVITTDRPSFLHALIKPYIPPRHLRSLQQNLLHIPRSRCKTADRGFRIYAPRLWNTLPIDIRECANRTEFVRLCECHLMPEN
jgi:hypothetical protein